jgi:hypothetical protein
MSVISVTKLPCPHYLVCLSVCVELCHVVEQVVIEQCPSLNLRSEFNEVQRDIKQELHVCKVY